MDMKKAGTGRASTLKRIALLFGIVAGLAAQAHAQSGIPSGVAWQFFRFADHANGGRETSLVTVGVPETDYAIAQIACHGGAGGGLPVMVLLADTFGLGEGAPLDVTLFADAGPISLRGDVKSALSDEDYTGVRVQLSPGDPVWHVLQRMSSIVYSVGANSYELPLSGSSRAISAILSDCMQLAGGQMTVPAPAPVPSGGGQAFDPRWASCDAFAGNVSLNSDFPVTVTFTNRTNAHRAVLWIGFDGIPVDYAALAPGQSFSVETYMTHPWMFTDGPGNCLEMFMPQPGIAHFDITAPNRDFGPE